MATLSSRAADFWTQLKKPNISSYNRWHRHFRDQRDLFQRVAEQLAGAPFTDTTEQIRVRWKHAAKRNYTTSGQS